MAVFKRVLFVVGCVYVFGLLVVAFRDLREVIEVIEGD